MKELELKVQKLEPRETKEDGCTFCNCLTDPESFQALLDVVIDGCAVCCS